MCPSSEVLKRTELQHLTKQRASKIMAGYELAPKPLTVTRVDLVHQEPTTIHPTRVASAIQSMFTRRGTKRGPKPS
jgi:hypothetical protein